MARIHTVNLYPRPSHSAKGPMLKITSGAMPGGGPNAGAHAFSAAQARAERKERERVIAGAPGHLIDQGLSGKTIRPTPIVGPGPRHSPWEGLAAKLQALPTRFKRPLT